MAKRYVNKKHLEYVHTLECCVLIYFRSQEMMGNYLSNDGQSPCFTSDSVQAHHLLKPYFSERGMSRKSGDADVIPLCMMCHTKLHRAGNEFNYFEKITGQHNYGQLVAIKTWLQSPYYENVYEDKIT
tara:strand:+ start:3358 stop:3741 length:384 start_codon:yes stop_codon:yes gene_type:complete